MYSRNPINKQAAIITSQSGCRDSVYISIYEVKTKLTALMNRHLVLKKGLCIKKPSQHINLRNKYIRYGRKTWWHKNPQLLEEYIMSGSKIQHLQQELRLRNQKIKRLSCL